jgi:hypothetical protein
MCAESHWIVAEGTSNAGKCNGIYSEMKENGKNDNKTEKQ